MQQTFPCSRCAAQNPVGQPFCHNCGQQFQYNCPRCRAIVDSRFSVCPNCRSNLNWPGQPVRPVPAHPQTIASQHEEVGPKKKGNPWLVGLSAFFGVCILVALLIFGVFHGALSNGPKPPGSTQADNPPASSPSTPPTAPGVTVTQSQDSKVKFELAVVDISGSGLSRTVTAKVTNTSDIDAHNVWAKAELSSQGSKIKFEGKDYLRVDLGTIAAGDTVTPQVAVSLGLMDGLKISQNGATLTLTIYSDEGSQTFSYDYSP